MRLPLRTSVSGCDYLSQLMVRSALTGKTRDAALCRFEYAASPSDGRGRLS